MPAFVFRAGAVLLGLASPLLASAQATAAFSQACEDGVRTVYGSQRNNAASCVGSTVSNAGETRSATVYARSQAVALGLNALNTYAQATHAEALLLSAPGASPEAPVSLQIRWKSTGRVSKRGGGAWADVYLGTSSAFSCRGNDFDAFGLPAPQNVPSQLLSAGYLWGTPKRTSGTVSITLTTPTAVLPLMVCVYAQAVPASVAGGWTAEDAQADMALSLDLPAGVSCQSRSGNAFKGQCGPIAR